MNKISNTLHGIDINYKTCSLIRFMEWAGNTRPGGELTTPDDIMEAQRKTLPRNPRNAKKIMSSCMFNVNNMNKI
jgi:hypothetical protein